MQIRHQINTDNDTMYGVCYLNMYFVFSYICILRYFFSSNIKDYKYCLKNKKNKNKEF